MDQYPQPMHLVSGISLISPVITLRIVALRLGKPLPIIVGGMSYHRTIAQSAASYPRSWWSVVITELILCLEPAILTIMHLPGWSCPHLIQINPMARYLVYACSCVQDMIHVSICGNDGQTSPHWSHSCTQNFRSNSGWWVRHHMVWQHQRVWAYVLRTSVAVILALRLATFIAADGPSNIPRTSTI